jgi:hypothetical protein
MTIIGSGNGAPIDLNDLGLKKDYGFVKALKAMPTYNDLMLEVTPSYIYTSRS